MSEDATRPSGGRFDTPTAVVSPKRGEEETLREGANSGSNRATAPQRVVSVFDPPRVRFDEQAELGRGGMGRVVEAIDLALDRPVAIKHLLATGIDDLARFEREVRITARLQHPSIVPILDAGRDLQGQPFYIMRKIDGDPLSARVTAATTARDRIALVPAMLGAIDAAAYAHAQGVIHRDIKPWNILLGPFGETLLIDWGIARDLAAAEVAAASTTDAPPDSGLTRVGSAVGTPGFMAPEQARGEAVDRRADVYSLGATLYFVLTGTLPFAGSEATIAISLVAAGASPDLAKIPDEVPAELTAIVVKALAADRAKRYADASELATDLRRFLAGQLVAAHRYTAGERLVRWVRRHRFAALVSVIALVAISATAIVSFRSVVAERDQARSARALAEARAEELLVDRARSMVTTDPTSAVALLRSLPASSKLWPVAREIVRAAVPAGVERGLPTDGGRKYTIAMSPGGRLATGSVDGIDVYDPGRTTRRLISKQPGAELVWRDEQTLVYATHTRDGVTALGQVNVETGAEISFGTREVLSMRLLNDSLLLYTEDGAIDRVSATGAIDRIGPPGAFAMDTRAGRFAVVARDTLVVLERDKPDRRRTIELAKAKAVRISPRGDRVAVLMSEAIYEWKIDTEEPPRRWPRTGKPGQDLAYVGETLYAWDDAGGGVVSLEGEVPITRWTYRGTALPPALFDDGMILATTEGRLAYVGPLGVVEIAHRRLQLKAIAVGGNGNDLVIAALNGDLMEIDLRPIRPRLIPVPETTTVYGATSDRLVIGNASVSEMGSTGSTALAIVELATGKRIELGDVGFAPFVVVLERLVVASEGPGAPPKTVNVWDLADGRERVRAPFGAHTQIGEGLHAKQSLVYTTEEGDLIEQPLEPFGPAQKIRAANTRTIARIQMSGRGLAVSTIDYKQDRTRTVVEWIDRDGDTRAPIEIEGFAMSGGYAPDGTTWFVQDVERVLRVAPDGTRAVVPLPQAITNVRIDGPRIWAIGSSALYELAPDGAIVRTVSLPISTRRTQIQDAILSVADDGLWLTAPDANVSRLLAVPGGADQVSAQLDGRTVAALTRTTPRYVAIWSDPVPTDASAIPAYIERLTNARLDLASSAVTWDRSPSD